MKTAMTFWLAMSIIALASMDVCGQSIESSKEFLDTESSVVGKVTFHGPSNQTSLGSGALIEPDLVLTCAHVVRSMDCEVMFRGGQPVVGDVVAIDLYWDWCLIRLRTKQKAEPMRLREEPLRDGMRVASYGYGGGRYGVHRGVYEQGRFFCSAIDGDSGGPIVDSDGYLIAVTQSVAMDQRQELYGHNPSGLREWLHRNRENLEPVLASQITRRQ